MTGADLVEWLWEAEAAIEGGVFSKHIEFGPDIFRNDEPIEMRGASVQGDKIQLY